MDGLAAGGLQVDRDPVRHRAGRRRTPPFVRRGHLGLPAWCSACSSAAIIGLVVLAPASESGHLKYASGLLIRILLVPMQHIWLT